MGLCFVWAVMVLIQWGGASGLGWSQPWGRCPPDTHPPYCGRSCLCFGAEQHVWMGAPWWRVGSNGLVWHQGLPQPGGMEWGLGPHFAGYGVACPWSTGNGCSRCCCLQADMGAREGTVLCPHLGASLERVSSVAKPHPSPHSPWDGGGCVGGCHPWSLAAWHRVLKAWQRDGRLPWGSHPLPAAFVGCMWVSCPCHCQQPLGALRNLPCPGLLLARVTHERQPHICSLTQSRVNSQGTAVTQQGR